jgi:hypothetical protein
MVFVIRNRRGKRGRGIVEEKNGEEGEWGKRGWEEGYRQSENEEDKWEWRIGRRMRKRGRVKKERRVLNEEGDGERRKG